MKQYVKDEKGKYKLVDKDQKEETEDQPQLKNLMQMQLLVEEINSRLKRVERIVVDPRK